LQVEPAIAPLQQNLEAHWNSMQTQQQKKAGAAKIKSFETTMVVTLFDVVDLRSCI